MTIRDLFVIAACAVAAVGVLRLFPPQEIRERRREARRRHRKCRLERQAALR